MAQQAGYATKPICQALYAARSDRRADARGGYGHVAGAAATGGVFYSGTRFRPCTSGAFFYADYALGFIRYFHVNGAGAERGAGPRLRR